MKLLVDENIPFAEEVFGRLGTVKTIYGREITNRIVKDYDILIVRSITKVNKELLQNSRIKFVGTATIGTDHIDIEYLKKSDIGFTNAAGSNANSVVEYVFAALFDYCSEKNIDIRKATLGIVGVGNIGGRLARKAEQLGIKVLRNDPPLKEKGVKEKFYPLDDLMDADFITIHTPLTKTGKYPTYHLFDEVRINKINPNTVLINTARGAVVDNQALLNALEKQKIKDAILDVWENEPFIDINLLKKVWRGTPHIAGYSIEGKVNGTIMIYNKLCEFLNIEVRLSISDIITDKKPNIIFAKCYDNYEKTISEIIKQAYNFDNDFKKLKKLISQPDKEQRGKMFDLLRKNYPVRNEFYKFNVRIETPSNCKDILKTLQILGFHITD